MNRLSTKKRVQVVSCLVEGNSVRSTSRLAGVAKGTILKLLGEMGDVCTQYHDEHVRGLRCKRLQADEIWAFCQAKQKTVNERGLGGHAGDVWTWVALDPDTKLIVAYLVGPRNEVSAREFLKDMASRISTRVQLSTDGNYTYVEPVRAAFGDYVDFGMVQKKYKANRYIGSEKMKIEGNPDMKFISTSLVERQNLNMRMNMRRFTRKTNGFSKKIQNLEAAVALNFIHHNFCKINMKLRVTPAMEAGLAHHVWTIEELVGLLGQRSVLHGLLEASYPSCRLPSVLQRYQQATER